MQWIRFRRGIAAAICVAAAFVVLPGLASAQGLAAELGPGVDVTRQDETGKVGFIGTDPGVALDSGAPASASPARAARAFVGRHARSLGLAGGAGLRVLDSVGTPADGTAVRLQQTAAGLPVLGGELVVNLDSGGDVLSVLGETSPSADVAASPGVSAADAQAAALGVVARAQGVERAALTASEPRLSVYDPRLLGAPGPFQRARTSWVLEVAGGDEAAPIDELVVVDAATGSVALHFDQIAEALDRRICDADNTATEVPCEDAEVVRDEGGPPVADNFDDVNKAYDYSGDTYDFYFDRFGRDSLDGLGMTLTSTVDFCDPTQPCPYQNAFWNGEQMVYGDGFAAADDVVGHELTHGFTDFSSHLFYYQQSGAINESMSDVFGELIDLTNGGGTDTAGVRWLVGEDIPSNFNSCGANPHIVRNMADPTDCGDPDRMTSPNYTADPNETDGGGVHSNSGVNNKAAYLITDGDTFDGHTVAGIGIDKAARIYYQVNNAMLTSASDYADLANALRQSCVNLIGTDGITAADCDQVDEAVEATEMDVNPVNSPTAKAPPPSCPVGGNLELAFADDLEDPALDRWEITVANPPAPAVGPSLWHYPQNAGNPYQGFDPTYATSGTINFWGDDAGDAASGNPADPDISDQSIEMKTPVGVPAGAHLRFNHAFGFDDDPGAGATAAYDGGVVEYSIDDGVTWTDAGPLVDAGLDYNATLSTDFGNPLGGREAFARESNGYGSTGLDLSGLEGESVRFRFRLATDDSFGDFGWFIDDVRIYACSASDTTPPDTTIN
ncbi:MAG: hypothetical protein GEU88_05775, partial [Solirubrobacterales bacterium]|nr:hypothetical protein [Solirubrobacterales bacterium]